MWLRNYYYRWNNETQLPIYWMFISCSMGTTLRIQIAAHWQVAWARCWLSVNVSAIMSPSSCQRAPLFITTHWWYLHMCTVVRVCTYLPFICHACHVSCHAWCCVVCVCSVIAWSSVVCGCSVMFGVVSSKVQCHVKCSVMLNLVPCTV